ncbi:MAG: signal peptidase I [Oscillospiraceae bacterium]|nr:signal peptidase I [Oscillospiraceae bacterium]
MKTKTQAPVAPAAEGEAQEVQVSAGRKALNTIVNVLLVVALVVMAVCTYVSFVSASGNGVPSILGVEFFSIQTDSMSPTLEPGDLAIGRVIKDKSTLRSGDIITYWTVINGERVLNTHRIDAVYDGGGFLIFGTKGDNNPSADPLTVHESEVVGKYVSHIPSVGKVFDYLQTSTGFLVVVVIPVFLFFLYHLVQFFRVLFEYQNVKNRLKYEEERGRTEDILEERQKEQDDARAALEEQIRAQMRAELMAEMARMQAAAPPAQETPAEETPAAQE